MFFSSETQAGADKPHSAQTAPPQPQAPVPGK